MVYVFALIKAYIVNLTYVTMHKQIQHTEKHMTNISTTLVTKYSSDKN